MLRSCPYCGKIHESKYQCDKKPKKKKRFSNQNSIRNTSRWKRKAKEIKERDLYLCRICLEEGTMERKNLEVHHITSLEDDEEKAFDNDNLLTVCRKHHELCEIGKIKKEHQVFLATKKPNIPGEGSGEKS